MTLEQRIEVDFQKQEEFEKHLNEIVTAMAEICVDEYLKEQSNKIADNQNKSSE